MKSMKKLIAALLVLTMVLALIGSAFAGCKLERGDKVKFTRNATAYEKKNAKKTSTIVRKGSIAVVLCVKGSWVKLQLTPWTYIDTVQECGNYEEDGLKCWAYWFKDSDLKEVDKDENEILVTFSQGGVGKSVPRDADEKTIDIYPDEGKDFGKGGTRLSKDCMKHVKATGKTWMHCTPSLSNSYGKALHKGEKVKYLREWSPDTRNVPFLHICYKGKRLWVSKAYVKFVK